MRLLCAYFKAREGNFSRQETSNLQGDFRLMDQELRDLQVVPPAMMDLSLVFTRDQYNVIYPADNMAPEYPARAIRDHLRPSCFYRIHIGGTNDISNYWFDMYIDRWDWDLMLNVILETSASITYTSRFDDLKHINEIIKARIEAVMSTRRRGA